MRFSVCLLLALGFCGCSGKLDIVPQPAPRPVSVITLQESDPARSMRMTGVVGSWKSEDIGFEVSGRVQYVIEAETNVAPTLGERPISTSDPTDCKATIESVKSYLTASETNDVLT